ncbi:TPA: hypothetical protein NDU46_003815 [Pseudomonas aeruginosa]|nr:hypothetical protein [Pseudomonas aeruginosa]
MSILNNAVASIQVGMEDFDTGESHRVLSAIRNIYAGILLLFKHKLQELSPDGSDEVLLKSKVMPSVNATTGAIEWIGKGKKTVEVVDIQERLTALNITGIDWKKLDALQKIRNDIEHYFTKLPDAKLREAVATALHLILEFSEPHLGTAPQDLLGQECWDLMLAQANIYDAELKKCRSSLESVDWFYNEVEQSIDEMKCPECESRLIRVIDPALVNQSLKFRCSECSAESTYSDVAGRAVEVEMESENHWAIKNGGEPIACECPSCGKGTYLYREGVCVICFESGEAHCKYCETRLSPDEIAYTVCGYCRNRWDRMKAE